MNMPTSEELDWMGELSRQFDLPVMFNFSQFDQGPTLWQTVEKKLEEVNQTLVHGCA